ncbi:MAG: lysophospholipid acyltransferase family protein [Pseudomonadota bacterium]|nr:lysophospholipid acyltransferase family protein [Pseudomonadota bacterium]
MQEKTLSRLEKRRQEKAWQYTFEYIALRGFIALCYILPWAALYGVARRCALLQVWLTRSRKNYIDKNLEKCFPRLSQQEILHIKKNYTIRFMNTTFETMKYYGLGRKRQLQAIKNRVKIVNPELIDEMLEKHPGCILFAAHYGNWEWLHAALSHAYPGCLSSIYKTLHNGKTDKYFHMLRLQGAHPQTNLRESKGFLKSFLKDLRDPKEKSKGYFMLSDQRPDSKQDKVNVRFLGRETAFLAGPEKLARQKDLPIVYVKMTEIKTGYYQVELIAIAYDKSEPLGSATKTIAKILEEQVNQSPENWLWGHDLWKKC